MLSVWKTITNEAGVKYSIKVVFNKAGRLDYQSSCDCRWGSFHRWTEVNKIDKWMCRHMVKAYAKVIKVSPEKARKILIKYKIMNKEHLVRI